MKSLVNLFLIFYFLTLFSYHAIAQDVMLQGWYWDYPKSACGGGPDSWADNLNDRVTALKNAGFTHLWLPPFSRSSFGDCSNGYDPKDLYDLGEYGGGATGFGTRAEVDALIDACLNTSPIIQPVADVVYNHRDGGSAENNSAVKAYITTHYSAGKSPFPSDRYRCIIPIGGATGLGAGDYYLKISSKTGGFIGAGYKVYVTTNLNSGAPYGGEINESEPNGGCDCGCQGSDDLDLNTDLVATIDDPGSGCGTDEIHIQLSASDYTAAGDQIIIYLNNTGGYSDHRIYGIYYDNGSSGRNLNMDTEFFYQTYTDFTGLPSGQGAMNFENFKPNSSNASTTYLNGDWDGMYFFYDADQFQQNTKDVYFAWSAWLWNDVRIRGYRMDAVKHFTPEFTGDLMDYLVGLGITPGMVVGEHFTFDAGVLKGWVDDVKTYMEPGTQSVVDMRAFDFALRSALKNACDAFGYDVRNVFNSGMVDAAGASGFEVVSFINNHDFRGTNELVINDQLLAYAYILTNNQVGLPCIFYPDYYAVSIPNGPDPVVDIQSELDELIAIQTQSIAGASGRDYLSRFSTPFTQNFTSGFASTTLFYQLTGRPDGNDVLVAINFASEPLVVEHGVNTTWASLESGSLLTELTGNSLTPLLTVNGSGNVSLQVPARSYAVWVETGLLPVELLSFEAKRQGRGVSTEWTAANETDLSGYELQRSFDNSRFEKVAWIPAKGNGLAEVKYQYFDPAVAARGTYYYRLKAVDEDGSFEYSAVRSVSFDAFQNKLQLFPNPANQDVTASFETRTENRARLELINVMGQTVYQFDFQLTVGENQVKVNTNAFSSGLYILQIRGDDGNVWREYLIIE